MSFPTLICRIFVNTLQQEDPIQERQPVKLPISKGIGNPWGRLSYADLITAAIMSTEEKRMTLEEIYQWLVSNIPYFGDKGDDKSKVNWKVSSVQ